MIHPRTAVMNRRMEVSTLIAKGYSPGEVAEYLCVSPETIYNDVRFLRSGRNPELVANSVRQHLLQHKRNSREIKKALWKIVDFGTSDYIKYLALKELNRMEQADLKIAGRIEKALEPPVEPPSLEGVAPPGVQDKFRKRYEIQMAEEKFLDQLDNGDLNAEDAEAPKGLLNSVPAAPQPLLDNDNLANDDTDCGFQLAENRSFDYEPEVGSTTDDMEEASD